MNLQPQRLSLFSKLSVIAVLFLVVGTFFTVQLALKEQQGKIGAWYTNQAATAICSSDGARIGVSFTNTETNKTLAMRVVAKDVQTGTSVDLGDVDAQKTKTGTLITGKQKLGSNGVVFLLSWTNGMKGTDSRSAAYSAITCTQTAQPTPTPTGTTNESGSEVTGTFTVFLHSVGHSGDNTNPKLFSMSNQHPLHTTLTAQVQLFNPTDQLIREGTSTLTYNPENGNYTGTYGISPDVIPNDKFNVRIKVPYHLRILIPGIQSLPPGSHTMAFAPVAVVLGDADNNNALSILDYNMLLDCYSDLTPAASCTKAHKTATDFNDDGFVNQIDYNLFLRELATQHGD